MRHGYFYAEYKDRKVFEGHPDGDGLFETGERDIWLQRASKAILDAHKEWKKEMENPVFEIISEDDIQKNY